MISFKNLSQKATRVVASIALVASQSLAYSAGLFITAPNLAGAVTEGQVPTTAVAPNDWDVNTVANVQADDFDYATESGGQQQGYSGFDFSTIPAGSTIDGIAVNTLAARTGSLTNGCQLQIAVSGDGGSTYSAFKTRGLTPEPSYIAVGGSTDQWGSTWTTDDLSSTNFVVKIKDHDPGTNCDNDTEIFVDHLIAIVYYTPAPQEQKYDICHATNSATNPYNAINVNESAIDGIGNGDHYLEHTGPLAETLEQAQELKDDQIDWGDIIPPVPNVHGGLNWTAAGQAILENDCQVPDAEVGNPYVRITFICKANFDGVALAYDGNANQPVVVSNGDYIFRVRYESSNSDATAPATVPYSTTQFLASGDIDKDEVIFETTSSSVAGASVQTTPANLYSGTASTNENQDCEQADPMDNPFVRVTFICKADFDGVALAWDGSENQDVNVNNGDYIFRIRYEGNNSDVNAPASVPYETTQFVSSGNIDKDMVVFETTNSSVGGVKVLTTPTNLYNGTASTNENQICEQKVTTATLNVNKFVDNDDGGTVKGDEFGLAVNGEPLVSTGEGPGTNFGSIANFESLEVPAGEEFTITEDDVDGYDQGSIGCFVDSQSVGYPYTPTAGELVVCNVYNYDQPATLTVIKELTQDNGANDPITSFGFTVNGGDTVYFDENGEATMSVPAGSYTVVENESTAYATTYENCNIQLKNGEEATCVISNDDLPAYLTLYKYVINDDGGQLGPLDFPLTVEGVDNDYFNYTASGMVLMLNAGQYDAGEVQQDGYWSMGWDWWKGDCNFHGQITVKNGGVYECTITNNDLPGKIVVHKEVINNNGGTKRAKDFKFKVDHNGQWQRFDWDGTNVVYVDAGWHSVYEDEHYAYRASYDGCRKMYVRNGETKHCYITNNDRAPEVKVIKETDPYWDKQNFDFSLRVNNKQYDTFTLDTHPYDDGVKSYYKTGYDLKSGWVSIQEEETEGWDLVSIKCYKKHHGSVYYVGHPFKAEIGKEYFCKVKNEKRNEIVVTKFNDVNQNGYWDEGEEALPGWDITLQGENQCEIVINDDVVAALVQYDDNECEDENVDMMQTTGEDGSTTFTDLLPGEYTVGEIQQDGWVQTNVYCEEKRMIERVDTRIALDEYEEEMSETTTTRVRHGDVRNCYVGNYEKQIEVSIVPVCTDNFPYATWTVTPNFTPTQFTVEWYTVTGNNAGDSAGELVQSDSYTPASSEVSFDGTSYTATVLWPGADDDEANPDWPGWKLVDGRWVEDPSDFGGNLRPEANVVVTVNPTVETTAVYPASNQNCEPQNPQVLAATTPRVLASTGTSANVQIAVGVAILGMGLLLSRRKRAEVVASTK